MLMQANIKEKTMDDLEIELTHEQVAYLNSVALQHLMKMDPKYTEDQKRAIYHKTVRSLSLHLVDMYWESRDRMKRGH